MPLLLPGPTLYSASILKSLNFCFETRLFAPAALVIAPSPSVQPSSRLGFWTPKASIDVPSKSTTGLSYWCAALALRFAGHAGGRTPTQLTSRVVGGGGGGGGGAFGSAAAPRPRPRPPPTVIV